MNGTRHRLVLLAVALGTFGFVATAQAEEGFPGVVERDLALSYQVPCSVCHIKGNTGSSTPITPFALSLRARGLVDTPSLTTALAQLQADNTDSDGDGATDVSELERGTDPNSSANANIIGDQEPAYGCGGSVPTGKGGGQALGGAVLLGWALLRRRRGRP